MKPAYLVRYADDWIIVTNTLENAQKLKRRISIFLKSRLKLELSEKKTKITNAKKRSIKFLGFEIRARIGKSRSGLIIQGKPDRERFSRKIQELKKSIHDFKRTRDIDKLIHKINLHNSKVQGIINYYKVASRINLVVKKSGYELSGLAYKALSRSKIAPVDWIASEEVRNLIQIHKGYKRVIAAIRYKDFWIGVTDIRFAKWEAGNKKTPRETIYSEEGRELYRVRTGKSRGLSRKDLTLSDKYSEIITNKMVENKRLYNFEFFMNRGYVYNVDKGKCRVCGNMIEDCEKIETHHICPTLPVEKVNSVKNLATTHSTCHKLIHSLSDFSKELPKKIWNKVLSLRNKLRG
jgi:hypothetical protein